MSVQDLNVMLRSKDHSLFLWDSTKSQQFEFSFAATELQTESHPQCWPVDFLPLFLNAYLVTSRPVAVALFLPVSLLGPRVLPQNNPSVPCSVPLVCSFLDCSCLGSVGIDRHSIMCLPDASCCVVPANWWFSESNHLKQRFLLARQDSIPSFACLILFCALLVILFHSQLSLNMMPNI